MAEGKCWTILENNPEVMNALKKKLGLSDDLEFYDVYSLDEPELLSHIPRPAHALLVIIPLTKPWDEERKAEDANQEDYAGFGDKEPVIWFQQTIGNACGSIGLLHSVINGPAKNYILPGSDFEKIRRDAIPLGMKDRAQMLYDSDAFEAAHKAVAEIGDTAPPPAGDRRHAGQHFISFVKEGGHLWELEGSRKGPIDRGVLGDDEDVLSPRALELGMKRVIKLVQAAGVNDLRFSVTALAPRSA